MSQLLTWFLLTTVTGLQMPRPNIVILMADDLGSGDVGFNGNSTIGTTNIDQLAEDGVILDQHLAPASVCTPSRAAFLTGRLPIRYGIAANGTRVRVNIWNATPNGLPRSELTFAKVLQKEGYKTALVGKWHLGMNHNNNHDQNYHPFNHGFDSWFGIPLTNIRNCADDGGSVLVPGGQYVLDGLRLVSAALFLVLLLLNALQVLPWSLTKIIIIGSIPNIGGVLFQVGFHYTMRFSSCQLWKNREVIEAPYSLDNMTQRLISEAETFLDSAATSDAPFLLMLNFLHVHTPLFSSPAFRGKSVHGRYGDNVLELDWAVGVVREKLAALGLAQNTIVYFSTDQAGHNEEISASGERHGGYNIYRGGKGMGGFEGGIRVPAVISFPRENWEGGWRLKQATSMMDIFPTILSQAGVSTEQFSTNTNGEANELDGRDITALLNEGSKENPSVPSPHEFMFHYCGDNLNAIRWTEPQTGRVWKLHYFQPSWDEGTEGCASILICGCYGPFIEIYDEPLLYSLNEDVMERHAYDSSSLANYTTVVSIMEEGFNNWRSSFTKPPSIYTSFNALPRPWLQPLCDTFPYLTC
ncbi:unnamed protein product [Oikopleura dioica]|uniref:Sulfatase N-terminal domain-containing protein n=1 Tax=Oikopleura dioica TaxID=34765 RepID=E4WX67_OIKDI|nr:unnamed protein product [Oikopleura dioica]